MSSKSSHEAMVAQVTNSRTSLSEYMTRQDSRSSPSWEKCCKSRPSRARGVSSSKIEMVIGAMIALHAESERQRNHDPASRQNHSFQPVNLTSWPCLLFGAGLTWGRNSDSTLM